MQYEFIPADGRLHERFSDENIPLKLDQNNT